MFPVRIRRITILFIIAIMGAGSLVPAAFASEKTKGLAISPDALTLEKCVAIALSYSPNILASSSDVESQRAGVEQAATQQRGKLQASASYSYSHDARKESGRIETDLSFSQSIFDWNRTNLSVKGAKQELAAKIQDEENTRQTVIYDVMTAYYSLNRASRMADIASERVENHRKRLKWAQDFYRVGTKAKIEETKAQTDLSNARFDLVAAQGARQKAVSALAFAMGQPTVTPNDVADELEVKPYVVAPEEALSLAMENRPDLKGMDARIEASRTSLALAGKGLSPSLAGGAGYSFYGESDPFENKGWQLKVSLNLPILDGGLTKAQTKGASAALRGALARREGLRQSVILSVRTAFASLSEANEAVAAASESERLAAETLRLAQGRYRSEVGDSLEISDAVDGYAKARMNMVQALYNQMAAIVELRKVTGTLLPDRERDRPEKWIKR